MNLIITILVFTAFASLGGLSSRHPTSPNQSNPTTPFPVNHRYSQSNQTPSSPANPIQQGQLSNPLGHPPPTGQNNLNPQVTEMIPPSLDHALIQAEQQRNLSPQSQSSNHSPPPVYERAPSQTFHPSVLVLPSPPVMVPLYRENEFVAIESAHQHGPLPHEFHTMDRISLSVLSYCLAFGVAYTSTWAQRPSLSTSIHIQCFLNQVAFSLFLLANAVFARTHPVLAFVLDRLSFYLIVTSAYLASMPMFPPYFAIIMFLFVMIVYIFFRLRG